VDLRKRWLGVWQALGLRADGELLQELLRRYDEPQRSYHSRRHLEECLSKLEELGALAEHPAEVELALWFHDAIYDSKRHDNEQRSADWARESVLRCGGAPAVADRVHALIMVTRHAAEPRGIDQQVLVDVDLSILGADAARFDEYEQQVREEYGWVPGVIYRRKRRAILEGLLARESLFSTPLFVQRYEAQARSNLQRSLARL
jgi:predicted metal-dependent HD superfamily phosphohydrolase